MLFAAAPDLAQRSAMLSELLADSLQNGEQCLQAAALKTAGFLPAELSALAADAASTAVASLADAAALNNHCRRDDKDGSLADDGIGSSNAGMFAWLSKQTAMQAAVSMQSCLRHFNWSCLFGTLGCA